MKNTLDRLPNAFYDVIAYFFSGIIFATIFFYTRYPFDEIIKFFEKKSIAENVLIVLIAITFMYIWGQISSTLSSYMVKKPIVFILKKILKSEEDEFFFKYDNVLEKFPILNDYPKKYRGNYWTLIYYIFLISPAIGSDVMKRYARCKLSRINSFNFFLLTIYLIYMNVFDDPSNRINLVHNIGLLLITIVMYIDFYQRQKWFNDIIIKIYASIDRFMKDTKKGKAEGVH